MTDDTDRYLDTTHPPPGRPRPFINDVLGEDVVAAPPNYLDRSWTGQGSGDIDRERYFSPEFHELEMEHVWRKSWQIAAREEDVPNVGDHVLYQIGDDNLIIVRSAPDRIQALHNSCLHRGMPLRVKGGCVQQFLCPFHGFRFGLDGALTEVPSPWDFPQLMEREGGPIDSAQRLPEARVETWGGFVFINMDPQAPPLSEFLEVLPANFGALPPENRYTKFRVVKTFPCNWKIAMEAFYEAYHVITTHPQALPFTGDANGAYDIAPGARHVSRMLTMTGVTSPHKQGDDKYASEEAIVRLLTPRGVDAEWDPEKLTARQFVAQKQREHFSARMGTELGTYSDSEILDAIQWNVFPNLSLWGGIGQPLVYLWRPNGNDPNSCVMDIRILQPLPEDGSRPEPPETVYLGVDDSFKDVPGLGKYASIFEQDGKNLMYIQAGLKAGRKGNTFGVYQESGIRLFHRTLDEYIQSGQETRQ